MSVVRTSPFLYKMLHSKNNRKGVACVFGQNVDRISVSHANNLVRFQTNAYWWFTSVNTRGLRVMSRWTVGIHQSRGHTKDIVDIEWFVDSCWKEVFFPDRRGKLISGSRQTLASALLSGHRVRFQILSWNYYTAEANSLHVHNGHVTAQALKHVITNSNLGASCVWLMVSTTGIVRVTKYEVEGNKRFGDFTYCLSVRWFVDTRPWGHVLSNDPTGHVLSGNRSALV